MTSRRPMRVLFCHRPGGAFGYISDGMCNAFAAGGHLVARWDGKRDSWDAFDPDLFISASGHRQFIPVSRRAKVAIHVNPYGRTTIPGINESPDAIEWVLKQKPDVVFGYGTEQFAHYWERWPDCGIPWIPMPTAADATIFRRLDTPRLYDIVYLGGYWKYKGSTINSFLLPLLQNVQTWKVHGWGDWPVGINSGELSPTKSCEFLNSGLIGPCISEQHTHEWGIDIPERAFKVAACGALVLHDNTTSIRELIPSAVVCATPTEMIDKAKYYLANPKQMMSVIAKQHDEVLAGQTYRHRMAALLSALGFRPEADAMVSGF